MATPIYGFEQIEDGNPYSFRTLSNGLIQSVEDGMPHRYVASIAALSAMTGALYPNGMSAVLTANSSGVNAGAVFTRAASKWLFTAGTITNLTTFVGALTANVRCMQGATFFATDTSTARMFTTETGNSEVLIGGNTWTNISYAGGYARYGLQAPLSYRLVPGGAILRGSIGRPSGAVIPAGSNFGGTNIPSAARPSYLTRGLANGMGNAFGFIEIATNGTITLYATANRTSSYYVLDGIFLPQT